MTSSTSPEPPARKRLRSSGRLQAKLPVRVSLASRQPSKRFIHTIEGKSLRSWFGDVLSGLPSIEGSPICLEFLPELTAHRGQLLSGDPHRGRPVHAASYLRERRIVIESALLIQPVELRLILVHEIFHFVWLRLSNAQRDAYRSVLTGELSGRARGELGESSGVAKDALTKRDWISQSPNWHNYVCESFCDTSAWLYAGVHSQQHFRLAARWRRRREAWFKSLTALRA